MNSKTRTRTIILVILVLTMSLLSACMKEENKGELEGKLEGTLKVMYFQENQFFQKYGNYFMNKFPNVEFEVVNTQWLMKYPAADSNKAFKEYIEERKPDVLYLDMSSYPYAIENDLLHPLDSVIQQDKFDLEGILPMVTDWLKKEGSGGLYALAPEFSTSGLYYNIDLFEKYNIELPRNQMSYQEVLNLAEQFPVKGSEADRIYGLSTSASSSSTKLSEAIFGMTNYYGTLQGLSYVSADGKNITLDSPQWRNIYENVVDTYQSGVISPPGGWENDLFLNGRAAMVLEGSYYLNMISQAEGRLKSPLRWGVVTQPVNSQNPDVGLVLGLSDIFGVYADSPNKKLAWEFIKFASGTEVAKSLSRAPGGSLSVRPDFIPEANGTSLNAFYELTKMSDFNYPLNIPEGYESILQTIFSRETEAVLAGEQTIDEALQKINVKGNEQLKEAHIRAALKKEKSK
ncbi:multiple sugar transport system substrate-binding protein [Paenibacillaceae bacterium GAS479]|nr:multiple sugar transport system substrate-binding protein [Paenibacillaceae bacterium GAS479]